MDNCEKSFVCIFWEMSCQIPGVAFLQSFFVNCNSKTPYKKEDGFHPVECGTILIMPMCGKHDKSMKTGALFLSLCCIQNVTSLWLIIQDCHENWSFILSLCDYSQVLN